MPSQLLSPGDLAKVVAARGAQERVANVSAGRIEEIDDGQPQDAWIEQLARPVVRAWKALVQTTLADKSRPAGATGRLAVAEPEELLAAREPPAPGLIRVSGRSYSSASMVAEEDRCEASTVAVATW